MLSEIEEFVSTRSPSTREYYRNILTNYFKVYDRLTAENVKRYVAERYKKISSRNTALRVFKSFAKWRRNFKIPPVGEKNLLERWEMEKIEAMPSGKVVTPLVKKELSDEELKSILDLPEPELSGVWCLAYFGCRPRELTSLRLRDINFVAGEVTFITEKTKVPRKLFFNDFTATHLEKFVKGRYSYSLLYSACKRLGFTPRMLRSTFNTRMMRKISTVVGMIKTDLLIKYLMGHTTTDITSKYTDYLKDAREVMLRHHYLADIFPELFMGKS